MSNELEEISKYCVEFHHVGSRVTCNPPPIGTDDDYLALVSDHEAFRNYVVAIGFDVGGSMELDANAPLDAEDRFSSYTKGEVNLIVSSDADFCNKFLAATHVAKRLNLLEKQDRIALFQAVLYANQYAG